MFKNKNKTTGNSLSLEQRTDNSLFSRAKLVLAAAGLAFLPSIFGCNADYYRRVDDPVRAESFMAFDYHGSPTAFIQQLDKTEAADQPPAGVSDPAVLALYTQNRSLAQILNSAKDVIVNSLKRNTSNDSIGRYATVDESRMREIESYMNDLENSLDVLTPEARKRLAGDSALAGVLQNNTRLLNLVDMLYTAIADVETIEGNIGIVAGANARSGAIRKSLRGVDQYEQEGKSAYEEIKVKQLRDVASPESFVADHYSLDSSVAGIVEDCYKRINEEAVKATDSGLHRIGNKYLGCLLNIASEARKKMPESDESNAKYQALVRYFTREAFEKMQGHMRELESAGNAGFGSVVNVESIFMPFLYAWSIGTSDTFDADGHDFTTELGETLKYGNAIKNGMANRYNWAGSLSNRRTKFWTGVVADLALIAGAVGGGVAYNNSLKSEASPSYNPTTQGGETGGPGTQN